MDVRGELSVAAYVLHCQSESRHVRQAAPLRFRAAHRFF